MHSVILRQCNNFCNRLYHSSSSSSLSRRKCINHRYFIHKYCKLGTIVSNKSRLFSYYSHCIPKPVHIKNKNFGKITNDFGYAGEDSFFTYKLNLNKLNNGNHTTNGTSSASSVAPLFFIGVADGVGSWKPKKAQDAAKYAQELMLSGIHFLSNASINDIYDDEEHLHCYNLSHKIATHSSNYVNHIGHFDGASTICILSINEYNIDDFKCQLNAFNLGDSGFTIFRHKHKSIQISGINDCYESIYKSPVQEQGFGIPYQLGSHPTANKIDDGYCLQHFNLKSLDIIIVGSDGLWDNLFDHELSNILCSTMTKYHDNWKNNSDKTRISDPLFNDYVHSKIVNGDLTHKIIKQAYMNSIDKKKPTPWSESMTETVEMVYNGGKPDDITCVVVFIH